MIENVSWKSILVSEWENFDNIPYEELINRVGGNEPNHYNIKVDTRSFYEKYSFFVQFSCLFILLCVVEWFLF